MKDQWKETLVDRVNKVVDDYNNDAYKALSEALGSKSKFQLQRTADELCSAAANDNHKQKGA